eukprot:COSAG03_NODE_33520_length_133_cov_68.705882_1_plen_37_part_01
MRRRSLSLSLSLSLSRALTHHAQGIARFVASYQEASG